MAAARGNKSGAAGRARRHTAPYALAQDFLRERGTELELADRPRGAFPPADKDALLLENNGADLPQSRQTRLREWVTAGGLLVLEVGMSWPQLEDAYPDAGFDWVEFERGGEGVCIISADELLAWREAGVV